MANMIARLGVVLGLDTAEFNKGIENAGKKLEQFSQTAEKFGKIGATALVAASAAALQYADDIADVAKANDVAIGTVLKLSNALGNAGGKASDSGKMLASFTKFIDDAAGGSVEAQKTTKMLGITLQDLGKLSEEELLNKVVKNLGLMDDSVTRGAKGMEIFGKSFKGVDAIGFAEDMAKANKVTKEQEQAIKDAADVYDLLAQSSRNTMLVIATQLGPVLKASIDYIKDLAGETNLLGPIFKTVFQTIAISVADVAFVLGGLLRQMQLTLTIFKSVIPSYDDKDFENVFGKKEIADIIARQDLDRFINKVMGVSEYGNSIDAMANKPISSSASGGRKVTPAKDKDAEEAERRRLKMIADLNREAQRYAKLLFDIEGQQVAAYTSEAKRIEKEQRGLEIKNQLLFIDQKTMDMRSEDAHLTRDLYLSEQKRLDTIQEINRNNLLDADAKEQLVARENALADATERYLRAQNQAVKAQREGTGEQGFLKEGAKFFRDMPTDLENGAKAFQSVMGNMESALDNFVRTGKLSFKSLARSIIQDLIAIQLRASATGIFKQLFGMYAGGGFGTGNAFGNQDLGGFLAEGGSANANTPYVVGERGPELFVPRSSGTVIPNHALAGAGGTTMVTNNYINAIDTKSFEERLYGSSNAIWAANQYANKSLAVNRGRA
jgi:lambda family phage tail tape measure protein